MTSVIQSARRSTSSVFDVVTKVADVSTQLITTAARGVDMLDSKASLMHKRVTLNTAAQLVIVQDDEIMRATTEHTDLMAETHARNFPGKPFDREQFFTTALAKITAAVEAA